MHNIRFRQDSEKLKQGRRPLLDALGLRALRQHCITHQHDSVIDITKWAQEYFQKPLSINTIHRAICRCQLKLYHAKRKPYVNMVQKRHRVLWAKAHLKWTFSGKVFYGQTSLNLTFLLEIMNAVSSGLKRRETFQRVISVQFKSQHLWWNGVHNAYGMGSLHVLEGTMNAERYIKILEQHMLPSRRRVFQQDNAKPHTAAITTAWLHSRRVRVLNWPACSPDLSPIENIWHIIKRKIRQRRPRTLQQLETYIRQEWDQIPTPKHQQLITSMPRHLQTVLKRRDVTPW